MLVLTRKLGQEIEINGPSTVRLIDIKGTTVRIGIKADKEVPIVRAEIADRYSDVNTKETVSQS